MLISPIDWPSLLIGMIIASVLYSLLDILKAYIAKRRAVLHRDKLEEKLKEIQKKLEREKDILEKKIKETK